MLDLTPQAHFLRRRWCCCPRRKKKPDLLEARCSLESPRCGFIRPPVALQLRFVSTSPVRIRLYTMISCNEVTRGCIDVSQRYFGFPVFLQAGGKADHASAVTRCFLLGLVQVVVLCAIYIERLIEQVRTSAFVPFCLGGRRFLMQIRPTPC